jgi:hypothetical protein
MYRGMHEIHRQNSYAPRSRPYTGRRETQSREAGQQSKNPSCVRKVKNIMKGEITEQV